MVLSLSIKNIADFICCAIKSIFYKVTPFSRLSNTWPLSEIKTVPLWCAINDTRAAQQSPPRSSSA